MSINFYFEDTKKFVLKRPKRIQWIKNTIEEEGKKAGDISFVFCSDDYLLEINKQYLNHDYYTDIITFDYVDDEIISGDIFVSIDRVEENADKFGVTFENELNRILIHGVLHLVGYKDKEKAEKELMTSKEDFYLRKY